MKIQSYATRNSNETLRAQPRQKNENSPGYERKLVY